MKISFQTITCKRCEGTGGLSHFIHIQGGMCFGCLGKGKKLTRKGAAAKRVFEEAAEVRAHKLEVGMAVNCKNLCLKGAPHHLKITAIRFVAYKGDSLCGLPGQEKRWMMMSTVELDLEDGTTFKDSASALYRICIQASPGMTEIVRDRLQNMDGVTVTDDPARPCH